MGIQVFRAFCSGCHGPNGFATFTGAPSFALGDRMDKGEEELYASVLDGHNLMPQWADKLPRPWLRSAIRAVRGLSDEFRGGVLHTLRPPPEFYFRFGRLSSEFGAVPDRASTIYGSGASADEGDLCRGVPREWLWRTAAVTDSEGEVETDRVSDPVLDDASLPPHGGGVGGPGLMAYGVASASPRPRPQASDSLPPGVTMDMVRRGKRIFEEEGLCYSCHGPEAGGLVGPDLTSPGWWYAEGSYLAILRQIVVGVPEAQSLSGVAMPPRGGSDISDEDVQAVAAYVWRVSHATYPDSLPSGVTPDLVRRGQFVFSGPGGCYTCHGRDAGGALGPNLTDREWLHMKGSYLTILQQVLVGVPSERSRSGVEMPPRGGALLSDADVQAVAAYVWALSRGITGG